MRKIRLFSIFSRQFKHHERKLAYNKFEINKINYLTFGGLCDWVGYVRGGYPSALISIFRRKMETGYIKLADIFYITIHYLLQRKYNSILFFDCWLDAFSRWMTAHHFSFAGISISIHIGHINILLWFIRYIEKVVYHSAVNALFCSTQRLQNSDNVKKDDL